MNTRRQRLAACVWLLEHGEPEVLIEHLDGVLLVDAWPEIATSLHPPVRQAWAPLVTAAEDHWVYERMRADFAADRPRKPGRHALTRTITRLAAHGLSREQIEDLLRHPGR